MLRPFLCTSLLALALLVPATAAYARVVHLDAHAGAEETLTAGEALRKAEAALDGRAAHGTHVTVLLKQVAAGRGDLSAAERRRADRLLARPTQGDGSIAEDEYDVPEHNPPLCSAHYCMHWVDTTADAPSPTDSNTNGIPDYVETMNGVFEEVYAYENGQLGWRPPTTDGNRGCPVGTASCVDKTDVYIKETGGEGLYGYAATDPDQGGNSRAAYLVMDNDYSAEHFPRYAGNALAPMQVTAAHEYNHVLQFGYDAAQDAWMFESTATWMEDKAYPHVDDYLGYLPAWARVPYIPLTQFDPEASNHKVYGDAVWNRWLDARHGEETIRVAWESSLETEPESYAPGAYERALRMKGSSFFEAFSTFAAETAEWRAADTPFADAQNFPDMVRAADDAGTIRMPVDGVGVSGSIDHTAYYLVDVAVPEPAPPRLRLAALTQRGAQQAVALVGREGGETTGTSSEFIKLLPRGGPGIVEIDNPGRFTRLTAVFINSDVQISGFSRELNDWAWDNDGQAINARISTDFTAPRVRRRAPRPRARRVSRRSRVVVAFSDPMVLLNSRTVRLIGPGGRRVRAKLSLTRRGRRTGGADGADRVTLTPRRRLARGGRHVVKLHRDLRDLGGNALPSRSLTWSFTTKRR